VGAQEVRWDKHGTKPADDYTFFCGNENVDYHLHKGIISAVKRIQFFSDRMSYIIPRGCWSDIIFLSVHAPTEDKCKDMKDSVYEQLEHVFSEFLFEYHMNIL
jgi:hypothetical protein